MDYRLNREKFICNYCGNSDGFRHSVGKRGYHLFPFIARNDSPAILDLDRIAGRIISDIEGMELPHIQLDELIKELMTNIVVPIGQEGTFKELIADLFFDENKNIRPLNLKLLETSCQLESREKKLAAYIASVLGDKDQLTKVIKDVHLKNVNSGNVLENMIVLNIAKDSIPLDEEKYFRVTYTLKECFEQDFMYILETEMRTRDYLIKLLEFYYFSYTAQTAMTLDRFFEGNRDEIIPLYFSLEWEKTSLSRRCYSEGWQKLQKSLDKMFAHAVVLDFLNLTDDDFPQVDYISLKQLIEENQDCENLMIEEVAKITDLYRSYIRDCSEMKELQRRSPNDLEAEIKYLFKSVKTQFEVTKRKGPYNAYSEKFKKYCNKKYLKNRGRSGMMLNLTEADLIFLTKVSIKDKEQLRLKEVFDEFEARGIFLDDVSKDQVAAYYEKLNLIEKKSDSGDAKYVKRIL